MADLRELMAATARAPRDEVDATSLWRRGRRRLHARRGVVAAVVLGAVLAVASSIPGTFIEWDLAPADAPAPSDPDPPGAPEPEGDLGHAVPPMGEATDAREIPVGDGYGRELCCVTWLDDERLVVVDVVEGRLRLVDSRARTAGDEVDVPALVGATLLDAAPDGDGVLAVVGDDLVAVGLDGAETGRHAHGYGTLPDGTPLPLQTQQNAEGWWVDTHDGWSRHAGPDGVLEGPMPSDPHERGERRAEARPLGDGWHLVTQVEGAQPDAATADAGGQVHLLVERDGETDSAGAAMVPMSEMDGMIEGDRARVSAVRVDDVVHVAVEVLRGAGPEPELRMFWNLSLGAGPAGSAGAAWPEPRSGAIALGPDGRDAHLRGGAVWVTEAPAAP